MLDLLGLEELISLVLGVVVVGVGSICPIGLALELLVFEHSVL